MNPHRFTATEWARMPHTAKARLRAARAQAVMAAEAAHVRTYGPSHPLLIEQTKGGEGFVPTARRGVQNLPLWAIA